MINKIFAIIQLCDSNFPSGAFSHSFGLETFIQQDLVKNRETFEAFLKEYVFQNLVYNDGLATRIAYEFVENGDEKALWTLDEMLYISCTAAESREASRRIGQQMIRICKELYPSDLLLRYSNKVKTKECYGHSAIVIAIICKFLSISKELAITTTLYASVSSMIQNAVRGIPLGQTDGQLLLLKMQEIIPEAILQIERLTIRELGCTQPSLEIAQMQHEQLSVRLFMS